jgi:two-component system heavy metal sensor histidine kinase CusS
MPWPPLDRVPWATLRLRLTIWNTLVVLLMAIASLLAARFAARATLYADADAELRAAAREVVLALRDLSPDIDAVVAEIGRKAESHEQRGWFMQLLREDGTTLWKSEHCPAEVATFPPSNLGREENVVQVGPYRYVRLRIERDGQPVYHVRVGTYTTGLDAGLSSLMRVLLAVGGILCLLTPLAGWWLARQATQPVAAMLHTAEQLKPTRLGDRLPVRGTADELDTLAITINRLLDQVAAHVDRQQQFVADAAHELRGPLAAVRSSLEVAISHDRSVDEYRETLADVLDEACGLSKLSNDLLTLTEASDVARPPPSERVDLAALARQSVAMFSAAGEERGLAIDLSAAAPTFVAGDAPQLRQVLGNLLDNAIRFTPPGGRVEVGVELLGQPAAVVLTVTDSGVGIAARHIGHVFDRFFKADAARSHDEGGRSGGLGLSICKAIVERHRGEISVTSTAGLGTTFTVRLPPASPPQAPHSAVPASADLA